MRTRKAKEPRRFVSFAELNARKNGVAKKVEKPNVLVRAARMVHIFL